MSDKRKPPAKGSTAATKGRRTEKVRVRARANRSESSRQWLQRHLNDPYVAAAKDKGFRSRAAFKLMQLDEKFDLLHPGLCVVDLGAAPGGWSQIAAEAVKSREGQGHVVGIDLLEIAPLPGATFLQMDFTDDQAPAALKAAIGKRAVDLVLSDMAAPTTGHARTDHLRIMVLAEMAYEFATDVLAPGGAFVVKLFQGGAERTLLDGLKRDFGLVRHAKPAASRKESAESYIVAQKFRGKEKA